MYVYICMYIYDTCAWTPNTVCISSFCCSQIGDLATSTLVNKYLARGTC